jgi:hypothetical protein
MLLADSAGMSPAFTSSFVQLTAKLYPKNALAPPIWSLKNGIPTNPRLQGIQPTKNGRYTVIFSEHDLTSGLLGTNTWPIKGYTPESAQALARNILLYTLANAPAASTHLTTRPAATQAATRPRKGNS